MIELNLGAGILYTPKDLTERSVAAIFCRGRRRRLSSCDRQLRGSCVGKIDNLRANGSALLQAPDADFSSPQL